MSHLTHHRSSQRHGTSDALSALSAALGGESPPIEFLPRGEARSTPQWVFRADALSAQQPATARRDDACYPAQRLAAERIAVVVRTSGSTGKPKQTLLSAGALHASAELSANALGGHGQWLLTLEPSYVAGLSVLNRSLAAGTTPVPLLGHSTDPQAFAEAAGQLSHRRRYVSLVPTQLHALLRSQDPDALTALQRFDTILLGGAAADKQLLAQAKSAGLRLRTTYGMSETCGGCIYDGLPFPGVQIRIAEDSRVLLAGPTLASGYLGQASSTGPPTSTEHPHAPGNRDTGPVTDTGPDYALSLDSAFSTDSAGRRWYRTDDIGIWEGSKLQILSRADDVINTGGVKLSAETIRSQLLEHPLVADAFVAGLPDQRWGQVIAALIQPQPDCSPAPSDPAAAPAANHSDITPSPSDPAAAPSILGPRRLPEGFAEQIKQSLGSVAAPKHYHCVEALPRLTHEKLDRQACLELLLRSHQAD